MRLLELGRVSAPAMGIALALVCACGDGNGDVDDGGSTDGGVVDAQAACEERLAMCFANPDDVTEMRGQCGLDPARRDCILAADSCALLHACYMGPPPDGSVPNFCDLACVECDLTCDAECAAGDSCVVSAGSCDGLTECLAGG